MILIVDFSVDWGFDLDYGCRHRVSFSFSFSCGRFREEGGWDSAMQNLFLELAGCLALSEE